MVCVCFEFGWMLKINGIVGCDYWFKVFSVVMVGGGIK